MLPIHTPIENVRVVTALDAYNVVDALHREGFLTRTQAHKLINLAIDHAPCTMTLAMRTRKGRVYLELNEKQYFLTNACKLRAA